jgi:hypothetical protein
MVRGYEEDGRNDIEPGTVYDAILPVWRVGEPLLFAARFARLFGANATIVFRGRFTGLRDRELVTLDDNMFISPGGRCHDSEVASSLEMEPEEVDQNLPELLRSVLTPLYERFDFFEMPLAVIQREVARLRGGRF